MAGSRQTTVRFSSSTSVGSSARDFARWRKASGSRSFGTAPRWTMAGTSLLTYVSKADPPGCCLSESGPSSSWGRVVVGWCGCDRSAGARAYLGARPWGRRRDGRWVDPRGTTAAARSLVDRRPWAGVATVAGAGRKTGGHLGLVGLAEQIGRGSGDWFQGVGAELAQRVEAAAGEFAGDRQRRPGVREPAVLERQVVGAVGACGSAGSLG
jgi:hypothetical protein